MTNERDTQVWRYQELLDFILGIKAEESAKLRSDRAGEYCITPPIEALERDGITYDLKRGKNGTYSLGYVRVSTIRQRSKSSENDNNDPDNRDGFSEQDQAVRLIDYFISNKRAFRIASDAGLSGGYPIKDDRLIEKMLEKKVSHYRHAFEQTWLADTRYLGEQREKLERYLEETVSSIRGGKVVPGVVSDTNLDGNEIETLSILPLLEPDHAVPHSGTQIKVRYRPALTFVMKNLHLFNEIVATDWSRLSRNYSLSVELGEQLQQAKIGIVGLTESFDWIKGGNIGDEFYAFFITKMAEYKLQEVAVNVLRGLKTRLESGYPVGTRPFWVHKVDKRKYDLDPDAEQTVRTMINLYLAQDGHERGLNKVALELSACNIHPPKSKSKFWSPASVREILESKALLGKQEMFGLEWDVFPAIITKEEFYKIQKRRESRRMTHDYGKTRVADGYVARSLLICWCGLRLRHECNNGLHIYICPNGKKDKNELRKHMRLLMSDVDAFFDVMFLDYPHTILNALRPSTERAALVEQIQGLKTELANEEYRLVNSLENEACANAKVKLVNVGVTAQNKEYDEIFSALYLHSLNDSKRNVEEEIARLKVMIAQAELKLRTQFSVEEIASLKERATEWITLRPSKKNALLLDIFQELRCNGDGNSVPDCEVLSPKLRQMRENELPEIPLIVTYGKQVKRRMPSVENWFTSW